MKTTIIIPTRNEEKGIGNVIDEIRTLRKNYEILVVDKSEDNTSKIAKKHGARVIIQKDKGKGNAMKLGVKKAKGDIVVFIDGDGTYPVKYIPEMIKLMKKYDFVRGSRFKYLKNSGWSHLIGNTLFSLIATLLHGKTSDLLTGLYCLRKKDFEKMNLKSHGFEIETEIFIKSQKMKLKTKEIFIEYKERVGQAKLNTLKDGFRILKTLVKGIYWKV